MQPAPRQQAADAARSFRMAMRLQETDSLAHDLALHQHFEQFVQPLARNQTCPMPGR